MLTDGEDSGSDYSFEEALEYARHAGVAIYTIGLGISSNAAEARIKLQRLARETGGESFYVERAFGLGVIYDKIQRELRSQYLIAYQSSSADTEGFREVEVEVARPGLEAKTIRGYYP